MKNALIDYIVKNKITCIFVSPHFDDVILSCAGLLEQLAGKTNITVVNVFTKAHKGPYTLSARKFLHDSANYSSAEELFKAREKEDKKVLSAFPVSIKNLGLEDALFRRKSHRKLIGKILPETDHVYPTYSWHIIKKTANDDYAVSALKKKLKPFAKRKTIVFAPYGIGGHADHKIVRSVCEELFADALFYSDFPYNRRLNTYGEPLNKGKIYRLKPDMRKKTKLIEGYKTQFEGLFPDGKVTQHDEVYFAGK